MWDRTRDVVIIGGGPAGSTAAILLAEAGFEVTVLERECAPQLRSGESLVPQSLPLLDRLGVHQDLEALPHTRVTRGTTFATADGQKLVEYRFAEALSPAIPHGYQVRRDELDALLRSRAEGAGAEVLYGWEAITPQWEGKRLCGLRVRDRQGDEHLVRSRACLDASGQKTFLAVRMGWRFPYPKHRKVAVWSHFRGVWLPGGETAGNTTIVLTRAGWFWLIPLRDDSVSVGAVLDADSWQAQGTSAEDLFASAVKQTPEVGRRLAGASPLLPFSMRQNASYRVTKVAGDGFALIGDAAGFLDPIVSTGVLVAMTTAASAAEDVGEAFRRHGRVEAADLAPTVVLTRTLQRIFSGLIRSFYDRDFLSLVFNPSPVLGIPAAVASLLAGDVVRPGHPLRLARFHLLRFLTAVQKISSRVGKPLVPPVSPSPADGHP